MNRFKIIEQFYSLEPKEFLRWLVNNVYDREVINASKKLIHEIIVYQSQHSSRISRGNIPIGKNVIPEFDSYSKLNNLNQKLNHIFELCSIDTRYLDLINNEKAYAQAVIKAHDEQFNEKIINFELNNNNQIEINLHTAVSMIEHDTDSSMQESNKNICFKDEFSTKKSGKSLTYTVADSRLERLNKQNKYHISDIWSLLHELNRHGDNFRDIKLKGNQLYINKSRIAVYSEEEIEYIIYLSKIKNIEQSKIKRCFLFMIGNDGHYVYYDKLLDLLT